MGPTGVLANGIAFHYDHSHWEATTMTKSIWIAVLLAWSMSCQISFAQAVPASSEKDAIQQVISGYYDAVGRDPAEAASFYGEPAMIVLPNDVAPLILTSSLARTEPRSSLAGFGWQ
jgi:hypothetical protein